MNKKKKKIFRGREISKLPGKGQNGNKENL